MKRYHGQAPTHTFPPNVKPAPVLDVRDDWRRHLAADDRIGSGALRVALALLNFANRSGSTSVGIARLAAEIGRHRRNIERGLRELVAAGYLEREAGGGVRGNGGVTSSTRLKVPAAAAKVPATTAQGTGEDGPKVPATVAGQTLLTHITPAAKAGPGLEAGTATAENDDTGSATAVFGERRRQNTAGPGGELLRMLGELETSTRSEPRPVRDAVLAGLRAKFGLRPQRAASHNENSAPADHGGGSGVDALQAK